MEDYNDAVLAICIRNLNIAETGTMEDFKEIKMIPSKPQSYEKDYDTAITMLEFSVDTKIIISEHEFKQFVLDEWTWKNIFEMSNLNYKSLKG